MKRYSFTITIWEEDGVFVSKCAELEVASYGDTPEEALANIREAIELYLANAKELGMMPDIERALLSPKKFTSTIEVEA